MASYSGPMSQSQAAFGVRMCRLWSVVKMPRIGKEEQEEEEQGMSRRHMTRLFVFEI